MITMDVQRLRNLTTHILHTEMRHIYEDLNTIIGEEIAMTHMLPRLTDAVTPWLLQHATEPRLWDKSYDPENKGTVDLPEPTKQDREDMLSRYMKMPLPF